MSPPFCAHEPIGGGASRSFRLGLRTSELRSEVVVSAPVDVMTRLACHDLGSGPGLAIPPYAASLSRPTSAIRTGVEGRNRGAAALFRSGELMDASRIYGWPRKLPAGRLDLPRRTPLLGSSSAFSHEPDSDALTLGPRRCAWGQRAGHHSIRTSGTWPRRSLGPPARRSRYHGMDTVGNERPPGPFISSNRPDVVALARPADVQA